jgi:putative MATE family efflux protein
MESSNQFLGTERIGKLMQKYAIPCIISLLVGALYNIVDQIFIANASYLGSYGNAANTVVFPLTVVALAIAVMIGDGCCAFVSISLGQNEVPKAKRSVGNAVVMCLVSSIVLAALYLIFADTILAMFGGTVNAETYHHSQEYFFYITLGVPFYMFGQAMNPIIRADGNPRFAMVSTLAGAALNIILDPIFIFGFRWGMMGAAVATVIGQLVTAALAVWYLLHMKIIRPEKGDYRLKGSICGRTLTLGMTSFLSQISLVAAMAAINNMIRKYGALDAVFGQEQYAQIPMAVVGIVMKFFQIVISIVVGMAAGCIPVVGFNMGAKKPTRVKELFTKLLLAEATVGAVALVLVELLPRQLIALFGAANESVYYTDFAVKSFRIYLCMIILACVNKACFIFLQAMGKAAESTALSMVREVVFGVGFALLLPRFFGLDGVLYSMPMSDIYQLRNEDSTRVYRFEPYDRLQAAGRTVDKANYTEVYAAPLTAGTTLEDIYRTFNIDHPADFKGHSLSVSDVVVLHQNGQDTAHYCDSVGFQQVPEFLRENPLRTAELSTEQNENMIDGVLNNASSLGELEAKAKAGEQISLTDLAAAVKAEEKAPKAKKSRAAKPKKPSIRAQLDAAKKEQSKQSPPREKTKELEV